MSAREVGGKLLKYEYFHKQHSVCLALVSIGAVNCGLHWELGRETSSPAPIAIMLIVITK